ncbi:MAG: hypothetical protein A3B91_04295 [Candidatus Yanofskybacteria bacterium RIFCSPHIGHO2_02_FULL_41_29]|uniref:Uncharacterized protein n=1 Tax=Candidatus Yanofskybacteria bacterium RIFCSPHIGHO2_01_FULL_41_53 TaxID=1802663 RepID=A0A1F8EHV8_9BACT|nr:MAG: hypothetical protein A2650_03555 [Candidatus Yanofskybacteria bacterium RIFCSPHIGHO2_01_FULL_41_53]OGN11744.1 MAG: hypothetical protein A3B91_04295 [Candidatus Yanofskybacteria bacterium RIFCSPHIGHO2_02_FULL_41_29]OGN17509.1 MAG: hypothetical protein A3F48_01855 [Candidatus Yanofskybacteria bacterium RIFCSPHIGHO2_12_FULL_41_9]OGN22898.1 MAG: hypothetical protein A2916_00750 [Candidatus Yanofskybacteria bacterium RIFCSPLOWO2_01_FULL_41_67]OGN30280.1 MAG: hypothetical protein A3H54_05150 
MGDEEMKDRTYALLVIGLVVAFFLGINFLSLGRPQINQLLVEVRDTNFYLLPYVTVEINNLEKKGYGQGGTSFGRFIVGPLYEGEYSVTVSLGEESGKMDKLVYSKVHYLKKDMTNLIIVLDNVIQRFDIQIAERGVKIYGSDHPGRKNIVISPYKESGQ